jgi:hypothetical protein
MTNDNLRTLLPPGVIECITKDNEFSSKLISILIRRKFSIPTELIDGLDHYSLEDTYLKFIRHEHAVPEALINKVAKDSDVCLSVIRHLTAEHLTPPKKLFNGVWNSNDTYCISDLVLFCLTTNKYLVPATALEKLFTSNDAYHWIAFMYHVRENKYNYNSDEHRHYSDIIQGLRKKYPRSPKNTVY